jgi:osmotically-inducible protein OsmY
MGALSTSAADPALAVQDALADLGIDELHVEGDSDAIYLRGHAHCYDAKRRAGERAQATAPTTAIVNEIRVAQRNFRDDEGLTRDIQAAVARVASPSTVVHVDIEGGEVHLRGAAADQQERQAIEAAVWDAWCVERVHNHLALRNEAPADADIATALDEYVQRSMNLRPGTISVTYAAGVAQLSGIVRTDGQAQAIEDLVRWHERVSDVVSNLRVLTPTSPLPGPAF